MSRIFFFFNENTNIFTTYNFHVNVFKFMLCAPSINQTMLHLYNRKLLLQLYILHQESAWKMTLFKFQTVLFELQEKFLNVGLEQSSFRRNDLSVPALIYKTAENFYLIPVVLIQYPYINGRNYLHIKYWCYYSLRWVFSFSFAKRNLATKTKGQYSTKAQE